MKKKSKYLFTGTSILELIISILSTCIGIVMLTKGRIGEFIFLIIVALIFGAFARNDIKRTIR